MVNVEKFGNQMALGDQPFNHGGYSNGTDHSITDHLNTKQVKLCCSDKFAIGMFAIQFPTVLQVL